MITTLIIGRFQPLHFGHFQLIRKNINSEDKLIFCIINGIKSSQDKNKNPFSFEYRKSLILKVFPDAIIISANQTFIPDILKNEVFKDYSRINIICGPDRSKDYLRQIKGLNNVYLIEYDYLHYKVCGTEIRKALKENDRYLFELLMPLKLSNEFNNMRNIIQQNINN